MTPQLEPRISWKVGQFVSFCSALAVGFGLWVLAGWIFHVQAAKEIIPGQVAVKVNTAACSILIGFALWVLRETPPAASGWKLAGKIAAITVSVVGLLSLLEFLGRWDFGIDQFVITAGAEDIQGSVRPGLMSPLTAFGFLSLGSALLLLDSRTRLGRWAVQLLPCGVAIASMFGILDFVLDPNATHTYVSPVTASALFLFSFGLMVARRQWGLGALAASTTLGGTLTRRLVPAAIIVPLVIGWLRWQGESAGLYSGWTGLATITAFATVLLVSLTVWTGFVVDRSERERDQGEETITRLASIVTSSNDAIFGKTLDGAVTSWNPGAEAIYGYAAEEIIGQSIAITIPADRREDFARIMERVKHGEAVSHYETMRVRKDRKIFHVSLSVSPVKDKVGKVVGASTIARDVTERKEAEEKLRKASLYARSLIEASLDPLVTISKDGKIMDVNRATEMATGVERKKLIASDFSDYFTDPGKAREGYEQVFAEGRVRDYPLAIRHTSGRVIDVLYSATVFKNEAGEIEGVFAAARDITERKQAEEKVLKASLYARSLLEASLDPLVTISREGKITDVNEATEKVTGASREQLIGSDFSSYFSEPESARRGYEQVFAQGEVQDYPLAIRNTAGKVTDVLYNASIFRNEAGEVEGVFAAARNITERRRAERALQALSDCNEALVKATDEKSLLKRICDLVVTAGGFRMAWVGYAEHDDRKTVRVVAESGFEAGYLETVNVTWADEERGRGPTGTAIRTGEVAICHDMTSDPRFIPWRDNAIRRGYRSALALPLKNGEGALGAISIYAEDAGAFDAAEQHLLEDLSNNLSYGIVALRARAERKRAEEEIRKLNQELEERVQQRTAQLHESEQRVRRKLESILSPEGDLGHLELADLLDIPEVQSLVDEFYKLAHIPLFILDLKGRALVSVGWQEICTKFHRVHSEACRNCEESDQQLTRGVAPGEFKLYKCKNNLWDVVTPIMVGGQHVGNLFSGQFFFSDETVDTELFRSQARKYGFDEQEYLTALGRVPRLSRGAVDTGMSFYIKLAQLLSQLSYSGIKLARSLAEINRVNAELAASVKELEAFTYSVSHDLRAPLRHISGFSKLLAEEHGASLGPEAQHHLRRIQEGTRSMGMLVDDLLNLARVGRGDLSLQFSGLKSIVDEVIAELAPEWEGREIEWKIGHLSSVECDAGLMKQVFQNLLSNAVKFTRPRGQTTIEVGQTDQEGTPVVFVRDNGVGFNMKYADKLFGVFQRLHRTEEFEGTGVGLATVQRIVQKHGGRIWVDAELDKGATFYFTLGASEKTERKIKAAMAGDQT